MDLYMDSEYGQPSNGHLRAPNGPVW
jgi:hypothetical protein